MVQYSPNDRVGAMLSADDKVVKFLGYGTYLGEETPPAEIGGFNIGVPTAKIRLDNGKIVWGCETWWGGEDAMKRRVAAWETNGLTIEVVDIDEARAAVMSREPAETQ